LTHPRTLNYALVCESVISRLTVTPDGSYQYAAVKRVLRFGRYCNAGNLTPSLCANNARERINVTLLPCITARGAVDYCVNIVLTALYNRAVSTLCVCVCVCV